MSKTWSGYLTRIKVCYELINHLGSYINITQFQTNSERKNRLKDNWLVALELSEIFQQTTDISNAEDIIEEK